MLVGAGTLHGLVRPENALLKGERGGDLPRYRIDPRQRLAAQHLRQQPCGDVVFKIDSAPPMERVVALPAFARFFAFVFFPDFLCLATGVSG